MRRLVLLCLALTLAGCERLPAAVACEVNTECPEGFFCEPSEQRCKRTSEVSRDAAALDRAGRDNVGAPDAAPDTDGAPSVDAEVPVDAAGFDDSASPADSAASDSASPADGAATDSASPADSAASDSATPADSAASDSASPADSAAPDGASPVDSAASDSANPTDSASPTDSAAPDSAAPDLLSPDTSSPGDAAALCPGECYAGGVCYPPGDHHPDNFCLVCEDAEYFPDWAPLDSAEPCGDGLVCNGLEICEEGDCVALPAPDCLYLCDDAIPGCCGHEEGPCCSSIPACGPGLACLSKSAEEYKCVKVPCGAQGGACCAGGVCEQGWNCVDGFCDEKCGSDLEPCCIGLSCLGGNSCVSGVCRLNCGGQGESCCEGSYCSAGSWCCQRIDITTCLMVGMMCIN